MSENVKRETIKIFENVHDIHAHPDGTVEVFNMEDGSLGTYHVDELMLRLTDVYAKNHGIGYDVISVGFIRAPVKLSLIKLPTGTGLYELEKTNKIGDMKKNE